jgi:hypothetical protein
MTYLIGAGIFLIWMFVGSYVATYYTGTPGVLIMMSDKRSCHYNWLAFPSQLLCWFLWPISEHVAWWCFHTARSIPYKTKKREVSVKEWKELEGNGLGPGWLSDLDSNSIYAGLHPGALKKDLEINEYYKDVIIPTQVDALDLGKYEVFPETIDDVFKLSDNASKKLKGIEVVKTIIDNTPKKD